MSKNLNLDQHELRETDMHIEIETIPTEISNSDDEPVAWPPESVLEIWFGEYKLRRVARKKLDAQPTDDNCKIAVSKLRSALDSSLEAIIVERENHWKEVNKQQQDFLTSFERNGIHRRDWAQYTESVKNWKKADKEYSRRMDDVYKRYWEQRQEEMNKEWEKRKEEFWRSFKEERDAWFTRLEENRNSFERHFQSRLAFSNACEAGTGARGARAA